MPKEQYRSVAERATARDTSAMPLNIFVTGAAGFVGRATVAELSRRGYGVRALVNRRPIERKAENVTEFKGDLFDPEALAEGMAGCAAVIHLVGIIREDPSKNTTFERVHVEGTRSILAAARRAGVKRYVHMSALGTRENAASEYHRTKYRAEQLVRAGELEATIFRPSLIHGPGGEFMQMEAAWARGKAAPYLFMPYFGAGLVGTGGSGKLQPIFVDDVARAFVDAIEKPTTIGKTCDLGGADQITWPQMHRIASSLIAGKPKRAIAIPAWYAKALTHVAPAKLLPFNRAQVMMSQEDNMCDMNQFADEFGWMPAGFETSLRSYSGKL